MWRIILRIFYGWLPSFQIPNEKMLTRGAIIRSAGTTTTSSQQLWRADNKTKIISSADIVFLVVYHYPHFEQQEKQRQQQELQQFVMSLNKCHPRGQTISGIFIPFMYTSFIPLPLSSRHYFSTDVRGCGACLSL